MPDIFNIIQGTNVGWEAFAIASSGVLLLVLLLTGRNKRMDERLQELSGKRVIDPDQESVRQLAKAALPKMGQPLMPKNEEERSRLQTRLLHAGMYHPQAMMVFLGVKMLLMVGPVMIGIIMAMLGFFPMRYGMIIGAFAGIFGMIGPSFWLDKRKTYRQTSFRRALPDGLDVLVICLEGGLSLPGALRRVASEMRTAHPLLAAELNIVQREIQLGMTSGEALHQFAERADLEEVRSLASVISQAERFGSSLVHALRVHAETLRYKRLNFAEEMAQKAAVKILFPTVFCIFPGLFIVILGPAVIQIIEAFTNMRN